MGYSPLTLLQKAWWRLRTMRQPWTDVQAQGMDVSVAQIPTVKHTTRHGGIMTPGLSFSEMLAWISDETARYERWFATKPAEIWMVPAGTGRTATVRDLLHHVYAVDLRLAQRVLGQPLATDTEIAVVDAPALFALARRGQELLASALDGLVDIDATISWQTQTGVQISASRRKVIAHTLTHHIRHLAQVATVLRQHGHPTDWPHDLLLSDALG
jgi:uncharacterized damage-inducible protein DinB